MYECFQSFQNRYILIYFNNFDFDRLFFYVKIIRIVYIIFLNFENFLLNLIFADVTITKRVIYKIKIMYAAEILH